VSRVLLDFLSVEGVDGFMVKITDQRLRSSQVAKYFEKNGTCFISARVKQVSAQPRLNVEACRAKTVAQHISKQIHQKRPKRCSALKLALACKK
jgi:6-phosphofructokinase